MEARVGALLPKDEAKLAIYAGLKQYSVIVNGVKHLISADTPVEYLGKTITGEELYETLQNSIP